MAELFVPKILDLLGEMVVKPLGQRVNLVAGVEEEVANISSKLATIERVLYDAERRRLKEKSVGIWLEKLEDITYEIDDVLDEWKLKIHRTESEGSNQNARVQPTLWSKVRSFIPSLCSCLKQVPIRSEIALKIIGINEKLELVLKEANQFNFVSHSRILDSQDFQRIMTTSIIDETEVYGQASTKDALLDQILSKGSTQVRERVQIISIVGAGGSGKTTLAQVLYNDVRVKNHFELSGWVCVSDPFDQKRIAKAILESIGRSPHDTSELDSFIRLIKETFSGKRFLLVLDDVWTEEDSKLKPFKDSLKNGALGSVILVTTRSLRVARVLETTHTHHMALLSDSDCWEIMQRIAFAGRSDEWCKKVERIGLKIAQKCKGLPLAAKTMGSLLRFRDTVPQWQNVLDNEMWQLEEAAVELFPHLYLSYNELSPELKRCFSYCAVFPKDHIIKVEELIRMWIAQGYVHPTRRGEHLEVMGLEYFNNLAMRSFFQELKIGDQWYKSLECKMHDIVHNFAQFLTKNECQVLDGIDCVQGTERRSLSQRIIHLTWLCTEEMFISPVLDFGRFRSMILNVNTFGGSGAVPHDLFSRLKCVRTLNLRSCNLHEIPSEIGSLIHLRYLDLSFNHFKALPDAICNLYYLETFDIDYCQDLWLLPQRIEGLVHLRHLFNFGHSPIFEISQGLGELTSLRSLSRLIVSKSNDLLILKNLNQLEGLGIVILKEVDFANAELGKKMYLYKMSLNFCNVFGQLFRETPGWIETMEVPPNVQQFLLQCYPGIQLPSWLVSRPFINSLTKLCIIAPSNVSSFPTLWKLSSLEILELCHVGKLKYLGKEFFGITKAPHENGLNIAFPNLRKLWFDENWEWRNWEDLSEEDGKEVVSIMPRLEELKFDTCPRLDALPHRIIGKISTLKSLDIYQCPKLEQRYSNQRGKDWRKISHIPRISIKTGNVLAYHSD